MVFWLSIGILRICGLSLTSADTYIVCRNQRLAELSTIATTSNFNQVYPLQKPDYSREVTEGSNTAFVFVHLTSSLGTNIESRLLTELWRDMARKFGDVKFCEMRADLCIEGYPERNTPTILVYRGGDIKRQIVTLTELGGEKTTVRGKFIFAHQSPNFLTFILTRCFLHRHPAPPNRCWSRES